MTKLPDLMVTERTVLRPFKFTDVDDVFSYASDPEWSRYLPVPHPYTRQNAEQFIARQVLLDWSVHPSWAMECDGKNIGGINIRFSYEYRIGEIGYSVAREYWGQGIATEAARAVINTAFQTYEQLNRIRAMADARNVGSQRVMEKCGMHREGLLRENRLARGVFVDEVRYGLLRVEWTERGAGT